MKRVKLNEVVNEIVKMGESLKWFAPITKNLTYHDFISHDGFQTIVIDKNIIKLFRNNTTDFSEDELEEKLIEIIKAAVKDSDECKFEFRDAEF